MAARGVRAAVGGFAAYRADYGLANKGMRLKECSSCGKAGANCSSAHFGIGAYTFADGISTVTITTGAPANASDGSGACTTSDHRLRKFLITHEMGHLWLLLAIAQNGVEPNIPSDLEDLDETFCTPTAGGYSIDTLEWNSIGAREGIAHFNGIDSNPVTVDNDAEFVAGGATGPACIVPFGYPDCGSKDACVLGPGEAARPDEG